METAILDGFRDLRNSVLCGAAVLVAAYLVLAPTWVGFTSISSVGSQPLLVLFGLLGDAGVPVVWLVSAALVGQAWMRLTYRTQVAITRRMINAMYDDFDNYEELRSRLSTLSILGRRLRPFSNNVVYRVLRHLQRFDEYHTDDSAVASSQLRKSLRRFVHMGPRLIALQSDSFVEQTRLRSTAELNLGLFIPLPTALACLVLNLNGAPLFLQALAALAVLATASFLLVNGLSLWRMANSHLVHGLCDARVDISDLLEDKRPLRHRPMLWVNRILFRAQAG